MTDLTAALADLRPALADRYAAQVRALFAAMIEAHGPTLKGIHNSYQFSRTFSALVSRVVRRAGDRLSDPVYLDEDRLTRAAADYADAAVAAWQDKIQGKLGDLVDISVTRFTGLAYAITGTRAGKRVRIEQDVIVKRSTTGLLFNQFPARIYVDGKFTPEAAYKRSFA
jgi:hypothetical protein